MCAAGPVAPRKCRVFHRVPARVPAPRTLRHLEQHFCDVRARARDIRQDREKARDLEPEKGRTTLKTALDRSSRSLV